LPKEPELPLEIFDWPQPTDRFLPFMGIVEGQRHNLVIFDPQDLMDGPLGIFAQISPSLAAFDGHVRTNL